MAHYIIESPVFEIEGVKSPADWEPAYPFTCYVSIAAVCQEQAKEYALETEAMQDWVEYAEDHDEDVTQGLKAYNALCHHGFCWCGCTQGECEQCINEAESMTEEETNENSI